MYNIVLSDNKDFVLASCKTYELAVKYLKDITKTDKYLANIMVGQNYQNMRL